MKKLWYWFRVVSIDLGLAVMAGVMAAGHEWQRQRLLRLIRPIVRKELREQQAAQKTHFTH